MKQAAQTAKCFEIDPIVVLRSPPTEYAIRLACFSYITEMEEQAMQKAEAKMRAKGR